METSTDKYKIMVNGNGKAEFYMNRAVGGMLSKDDSSMANIHIRIATATMTRLDRMWCSSTIRFATKHRL